MRVYYYRRESAPYDKSLQTNYQSIFVALIGLKKPKEEIRLIITFGGNSIPKNYFLDYSPYEHSPRNEGLSTWCLSLRLPLFSSMKAIAGENF